MIDAYVAGFAARCEANRRPEDRMLREPGLVGLLPSAEPGRVRLLVSDDRAHNALPEILADAGAGMVTVLDRAPRCAALVAGRPEWSPDRATAMACLDLRQVPSLPLAGELRLWPVRRLARDPPSGVPLQEAVALAVRASPSLREQLRCEGGPGQFVESLRSLPPAFRLLAALDGGGVVRATAGAGVFGEYASVLFVNTDPDWRRRGIGSAMTAAALRSAAAEGAARACLDASVSGSRIYRRLGFRPVGAVTRFRRGG